MNTFSSVVFSTGAGIESNSLHQPRNVSGFTLAR